ncbi:MAG: ATP-binding cassette domain-containing protein [Proteobacteria bacterium]|nr:ATP-binding cassette domain-containing protein [Pseudomonadota bacterium]
MTASADVAIEVHGLSKVYRLWSTPAARLWVPVLQRVEHAFRWLPPLSRWLRGAIDRRLRFHRALEDINFTLHRGDALGIIGANGSGKSTLLQLVAGVLQQTSGSVHVNGRIAALLELGSGFNQEMTGRENVVVNAAILGMSRAQIEQRMDAIIAFADIGEYIDQPVKTYSSGMVMRLAFAVQVHVDPDILIVDEALSVGDARFQAKAMTRIDEILKRGTTLLFVGHDLNAVKSFCQHAMLLENGRISLQGAPEEVITEYLFRIHADTLRALPAVTAGISERLDHGFGVGDTCVEQASINGVAHHASLRYGDKVQLEIVMRVNPEVQAPYLILDIMDGKGMQITGRRIAVRRQAGEPHVTLRLAFDATLQKGVYRFRMRMVDAPRLETTTMLSRQDGWLSFDVVDDSRERFTGLFPLPMEVDLD